MEERPKKKEHELIRGKKARSFRWNPDYYNQERSHRFLSNAEQWKIMDK